MSADQPTAAAPVGRTREELAAASAALLSAALEVDCSDAAVFLKRRARQYDQQALDAPPAHLVSDQVLLRVVELTFGAGVTAWAATQGLPTSVALNLGRHARTLLADPVTRETLLEGSRHLLAGRCCCGRDYDHGSRCGGEPS